MKFTLKREYTNKDKGAAGKQQEGVAFEAQTFTILVVLFQTMLIILSAVYLTYNKDPTVDVDGDADVAVISEAAEDVRLHYGYMRDISIMIFVGFGYLMTFLRRYGFSAVGYTLLASVLSVQWALLLRGFFSQVDEDSNGTDGEWPEMPVTIDAIADGLFTAGAVMISFGALLGKMSPTQMVVLAFWEPIFYWLNFYLGALKLSAVDIGGGMFIHTFGCYFGLACTFMLTPIAARDNENNSPNYIADLFSYSGTIWLWIMWPSFNGILAPEGEAQSRALVNTFVSLLGSTVAAFTFSRLVGGHNKFEMVHIQNSTLAGGVAMGVAAHYNLNIGATLGIGCISGIISVCGYRYLTPWMDTKFGLQDVCGIHNLHGMPGVLSSLVGVFAALHASKSHHLYKEEELAFLIPKGDDQAGRQAAAMAISIGLGIGGGLFTSIFMRWAAGAKQMTNQEYFIDTTFWQCALQEPEKTYTFPGGADDTSHESHPDNGSTPKTKSPKGAPSSSSASGAAESQPQALELKEVAASV